MFKVEPKDTQTPPCCVVPTGSQGRKYPDKLGVLSGQVENKVVQTQAQEANTSDWQVLMHMLYSLVRNMPVSPAVC